MTVIDDFLGDVVDGVPARSLNYPVEPWRWIYPLLRANGDTVREIVNVVGKFRQGREWAALTGEQYAIVGPEGTMLKLSEDAATWLERLKVIYR